ncbi:MAG: cobyric acid synthase [Terracidiphilus sp.]|jgi:adenosylcobyric acid synthase
MTARAIMVLGASSHVGKSITTAALCRIFARAGYRVAPFKAQNMSLNSAVTPDGFEIGRAQALQAEAAGIVPSVHMNPILIKPSGDTSSQIVVRGKVWAHLDALTYHKRRVLTLLPVVEESYRLLASSSDVVVLEGAGSPAEINLKDNDIANMRMAKLTDAQCLLVGDIDRGGVFASLLGTCELLDDDERERIRGFVINRFRGDLALLEPGIRMMEQRLAKPCLGVIPYLGHLSLDEEDSVGLGQREPVMRTKANHAERPR